MASGVDAFSFDWSQDIIYAFPFNLISRVLQKIENEKAEGILIVPIVVNQNSFTRLLTLLIEEPLWPPSSDLSLTFPEKVGSIPPKTKIHGFLCVRKCLQEQDIPNEIADVIVQSW